jgi:hypothetical protein
MSAIPDPVVFPELIFGIAGPIGVDIDGISKAIVERLDVVQYRAVPIKLTVEMKRINIDVAPRRVTENLTNIGGRWITPMR